MPTDQPVRFAEHAVLVLPDEILDCEAELVLGDRNHQGHAHGLCSFSPGRAILVLSPADARTLARQLDRRRGGRTMSAGQGATPELVSPELSALRLLENQAEAFVRAAKAPSTLRAYRSDWDHFAGWCRQQALCPLPASPETIALYLTAWRRPTGRQR